MICTVSVSTLQLQIPVHGWEEWNPVWSSVWCAFWDVFQLNIVVKRDHLSYHSLSVSLNQLDLSPLTPLINKLVSTQRTSAHWMFVCVVLCLQNCRKWTVSKIVEQASCATSHATVQDHICSTFWCLIWVWPEALDKSYLLLSINLRPSRQWTPITAMATESMNQRDWFPTVSYTLAFISGNTCCHVPLFCFLTLIHTRMQWCFLFFLISTFPAVFPLRVSAWLRNADRRIPLLFAVLKPLSRPDSLFYSATL